MLCCTVADLKGFMGFNQHQGVQLINPLLRPNYFIFMGKFEKKKEVKLRKQTPLCKLKNSESALVCRPAAKSESASQYDQSCLLGIKHLNRNNTSSDLSHQNCFLGSVSQKW